MAKKAKSTKTDNMHWWLHILIIIGIIIVLIIGSHLFLSQFTRHNKELTVPDFTSMSIQNAKELAKANSLRLDITDSVYIRRMPRGIITRQIPEAGSKVKKNRRIILTINSIKPQEVEMPDLVGFSLRQARTVINSIGLKVGRLTYEEDLATNIVLRQLHEGMEVTPETRIETGSTIDLVLGLNQEMNSQTYIPDLRRYRYNTAKDILTDNSLNIYNTLFDETVSTYKDSLEAIVYDQYPRHCDSISYPLGYSITLYMSKDTSKVYKDIIDSTSVEIEAAFE